MNNYHGIIFAYKSYPELRELVSERTAASLPICSRYRLIDFALSSLRNAGIVDVGVIMQRDYQSLLDHLGSGKPWDMSRRTGGLRMLPPFGLPEHHRGDYSGTIEALNAVSSYIEDIPKKYIDKPKAEHELFDTDAPVAVQLAYQMDLKILESGDADFSKKVPLFAFSKKEDDKDTEFIKLGEKNPIGPKENTEFLNQYSNINENEYIKQYYCEGLYVITKEEPCIMCAMALIHNRISRLYFCDINEKEGFPDKYMLFIEINQNDFNKLHKIQKKFIRM